MSKALTLEEKIVKSKHYNKYKRISDNLRSKTSFMLSNDSIEGMFYHTASVLFISLGIQYMEWSNVIKCEFTDPLFEEYKKTLNHNCNK